MSDRMPGSTVQPDQCRFPAFPSEYRERWIASGWWLDKTLHEYFDEVAQDRPDAPAIVTVDRTVTFGEFKETSDRLAAGLLDLGVKAGDLVTVQLPNVPEFCFLQIALSRIGAAIHPMHLVFREREMRSLLSFCETDVAVVAGEVSGFDYAEAVRSMWGHLPSLRNLVVMEGATLGEREVSLTELAERGASRLERLAELPPDPDAVFYMNFTSGTEGDPKGFMHTHNSLISFVKLMMVDPVASAMPDAVVLTCSPMTHSFGHAITYYAAIGGLRVVLVNKYRPLDVLQLIQRERVDFIAGTPAHLIGVLQHPEFSDYDTSSIKSVMVGGARSAPEFIEMLERTWGITPNNSYGLGENGIHARTTAADPPEKRRDTVGKLVPGTELRIVDPDDRTRDLPSGEVGEIAFRGPALFVGYYRQPELTARTRDDDGWFYTGDLGFLDEDEYLHFASRKSEVVNRGGTKIYPKEIEDLLYLHPKVHEVAVVGMPDFRLGERVCAYIVPEEGETVTLEELASFLEEHHVTKHKIPERLVLLDELPMTPTGKVRKAALQDDVAERVRAETQAE